MVQLCKQKQLTGNDWDLDSAGSEHGAGTDDDCTCDTVKIQKNIQELLMEGPVLSVLGEAQTPCKNLFESKPGASGT